MSTDRKGPIDEKEWEAQERGMLAARRGNAGGLDAAGESYRVLAEALDAAPLPGPPMDFAAGVLAQVARQEEGFERVLSRLLVGVFVIGALVVTGIYANEGLQLAEPVLGRGTPNLLLLGVGCVAVSWMGRRVHVTLRHD
jgi:hypothetical protein